MWLGIHRCHSLPLWLVYSPRLLICLQGECTIGVERGHQTQAFLAVSADHSLGTHKIPSSSPPSAVRWAQPAATFCLPTPFTRGPDCTLSECNTNQASEDLVPALPRYFQDHGRFAQGCVSGSCDLWKLFLADEMNPIPTVWTIFKR